jgi:MFS transporter, DHA1 family, multidrug resistance protein
MAHIIRETAFGQVARLVSGNRLFQYPDETMDFVLPNHYASLSESYLRAVDHCPAQNPMSAADRVRDKTPSGADSNSDDSSIEGRLALAASFTNTRRSLPFTEERFENDQRLELAKTKSIPIAPQRTADGMILVDWYTTDDPANPQNWSRGWKAFVVFVMCVYTFAMYCASSIIAPAEAGIIQEFNISAEAALIPFALFVIGYGIGPLVFAPLSEMPVVGRNAVRGIRQDGVQDC